ncbi:hypothetical protein GCM10022406_33610 [Hymenobacter algoricola]|uniref:DUF5683 domain-containing protein n=2 Tax=Hymenobacter algoricola TaxID=486267 RepID=A0ABP7NKB1_9BACT
MVQAQQAPVGPLIRLSPEDEDRRESGPQKNFYFATGDKSTARYQSAGFFGQRLRPYLAGNAAALSSLNAYRRQKWLLLTERLVFVSAVSLYSQQVLAKPSEQQYFNSTQKVAVGVAAFSLLSNVLISYHTNGHFQRAVGEYNAGLSSARVGMVQRLTPSAVGLTAGASGRPQLALSWSLR